MGEGVCVRLELMSVCGRGRVDGWLRGSVLLLLMPSSRTPPHRLCPRHVRGGLQSGAGTVRSGLVSAEQRPQAGPATPLDDAGPDLAPCRYCPTPTPTPTAVPTPEGPVGTCLFSLQPLSGGVSRNQSLCSHVPKCHYCFAGTMSFSVSPHPPQNLVQSRHPSGGDDLMGV